MYLDSYIPLNPEFYFPLTYEIWPKIGFYYLPTHRRGGVHENFFTNLCFLKIKILVKCIEYSALGDKGLCSISIYNSIYHLRFFL